MTQNIINGLAYAMLGATDVDRSLEFYRDALGLALKGRFEDLVFFETGATTLALRGGVAPVELVFNVDSVTAAYEALKPRVAFVNEPRQVNEQSWAVNFNDPNGHLLSLYGPR